jgi:subtilisin-like proprotein convertase family protein
MAQMEKVQAETGFVPELVMYEDGAERNEFTRRVVTRELMLESESQATADQVAKSAGLVFRDAPAYAPGKFLYLAESSPEALAAWTQLEEQKIVSSSLLLARQQSKRAMPNDSLINQQWHLKFNNQSGAVAGTDLNIETAWDYPTNGAGVRGRGICIGIVDDGVQTAHPDFVGNIDTTNDKDWNGNDDDPNPGTTDNHGTACAGDAAAHGNNGIGVSGSAPEATLLGMRLIGGNATDTMEAEAMNYLPQLIEIKSNSWGPNDTGTILEAPGPLTLAALKNAVETGRGGKGTILMWAGGNGLTASDNSNYDGYANSIYTIAVGAFDSQSRQAYYSESGANLIITSPSDGASPALGKTTTDRTGSAGYASGDYAADFGGTSSATPTAAGVIALMLEANPNLGWRDVQEILMRSAKKVNPIDSDWKTPVAPDYINHNHKFGAGLIDATAAVNMAKTWNNLAMQRSVVSPPASLSVSIPDNSATGVASSFDFSASNLRVEHVTVKVSIGTVRTGQLEVTLTSPSGTVSRLAEKHSDTTNRYTGWTFMTVRDWGENSRGTWTLKVADRTSGTVGTLTAAEVTIYGTDAVPTNSPPSVTVIQSASGSYVLSGGNVTLTATASDFTADGSTGSVSSVQFFQGATPLGTAALNSGSYTFNWNNPPAGNYTITAQATDSEGAVGVSAPVLFTVLSGNGSPVIASFSTTSASVGSSVVLTGSNFVNVSGVAFSGMPATSFTVDSATQITAVVPSGAASGFITVTNGFGSGASSSAFTVTQLPVLISQIYGAGGNTGATYNSDYVELHNRSASPVNLSGWSVQYASSAGTSWSSAALSGTIGAGKYFLVKLAGAANGAALPPPDSTSTGINMGGTAGKVALMNSTTVLTGSSAVGVQGLQDFVGFGTANVYEGSGAAPSPSTTTAIFRLAGGATDTGDNQADFTAGAPNPRNSSFGSVVAPVVTSPSTASGTVGQSFSYQITANNSPTSFGATGLPTGLTVSTSTGLISGTPSSVGTSTVTVSTINSTGTGTGIVAVTISSGGGGGSSYTTDFEDGAKPGYASANATLNGISWNMTEALIGTDANDFKVGSKSVRLRGYNSSAMAMLGDTTGGLGVISFQYRRYGTDTQIEWIVEHSTTGGSVWTEAGRFTAGANVATFTASVSSAANGRVRIRTDDTNTGANRRTNIDEFSITAYSPPALPMVSASGNLAALGATYGTASGATSFTVIGQNLTAGILVMPPPGFEVSQTAGGDLGYSATQTVGGAGTVTATAVYLRLAAGTSAGSYSGEVICSSAGPTSASVAVPDSDVLPKSLTITANNRSKAFGTTLLLGVGQTEFSSTGLVMGETIGSVTLSATGGTSVNDSAGTYLIYPSDATGGSFSPSNYDITYSEGQFTVTGVPFSNSAPGADPDGNGLSNLMEYYMGISAESPLIGPPVTVSNSGTTISMTYRRYKGLDGVQGTVEHIGDLTATNWDTNGVTVKQVVDRGTYDEVTVEVALATGEAKMFMRLRVTQP